MSNFAFLASHEPVLARVGALAEQYSHDDPATSLTKVRQLAELLARRLAARYRVPTAEGVSSQQLLHRLRDHKVLNDDLAERFHYIRRHGNIATHEVKGTVREAHALLRMVYRLAVWYQRQRDRGFRAPAFVVPPAPVDPTAAFRERLAALEKDLAQARGEAEEAAERAEMEAQERRAAEAQARVLEGDLAAAIELAEEIEEKLEDQQREREAQAANLRPAEEVKADRELAFREQLDPDEAETRRLIDARLQDAGWLADSEALRWSKGTRPRPGTNLAIAEVPTESGPADYILFRGLCPVAVVEAKRSRKNVAGAIEQAKRYSRDYQGLAEESSPGGPWGDYRIPFFFATNGRPFFEPIKEECGIWFLDARRPENHPRPLTGWYSPDGLGHLLAADVEAAETRLAALLFDDFGLRDYQEEAVRAVEKALGAGRRRALLAMATGTGKTRTALALVYRLVKSGRFRRVLFVVDRSALGEQAEGVFKHVQVESLKSFAQIYDLKGLDDPAPEGDTRLQVATIQGLVHRLLYSDDPPTVDTYDCIVVDECHRGYTLDREMGEHELAFRDQGDYISKYRRVLDHFDAFTVGLTATPALHTSEIFGEPVLYYTYRQAVIDGHLIDHEPPVRFTTRLSEDGIHFEVGEEVTVYDVGRRQLDLFKTPDEIDFEVEHFNRQVVNEEFNRAICKELVHHIDPTLPGKTLVFCVDDRHADLVVRLLKEAFDHHLGGLDDDAIQKITGNSDRPLERIRHFKNEALPSIAVTVDLLSTGIDVPEITAIVFLRRVKSRILYEQMLGRATRLCPDLFDRGEDKEVFHIYDAVDLYAALEPHSAMRPVATRPTVRFTTLVKELQELKDEPTRQQVLEELIARLGRKRSRIETHLAADFEVAAACSVGELLATLRHLDSAAAATWFATHPRLAELLDRHLPTEGRKVVISEHEDEMRRVEQGYGEGITRPEDYLEDFGHFLSDHWNEIPALVVVTTRPRELTREQLKALKLELDAAGYNELHLRSAWRDTTNADIGASIIGFIRQQMLREDLVPHVERVDRALARILASRAWTKPQQDWLKRIGKQMKKQTLVDRAALEEEPFRGYGGFRRLNKVFDGEMAEILGDLHEEVWRETA